MENNNCGILTAISWNSNNWAAPATIEDRSHSNFELIKENYQMYEDLNFAHEVLPCEDDGKFIAYTPMFSNLPGDEQSKYVDIVFFRSLNYHSKKNCMVGFYAFPCIGRSERNAKHKLYEKYDWGNLAARTEHITLFTSPIEISNEIVLKNNYVPKGKKLGQQGFNYLTSQNVINILDKATILNPTNNKIKKIKYSFLTKPKYQIK